MSSRQLVTLGLLLAVLSACVLPPSKGADPTPEAAAELIQHLPEAYRTGARQAFRAAGENAATLETCLREIILDPPEDRPAELEAAGFLLANLSPNDLASLRAEDLLEHIAWLRMARLHLPWVASIPKEILLHYVLPPRIAQERLGPWRRELFQAIAPRVAALKNMSEVALEVNRWCGERVKFVQTEFRDQGPMESLRSGYGRCEEMMIVYIAAARAVGIPARGVSTPWWATGDNNHAWVEAWTDGAWHFLGACEPAPTLDNAWFRKSARRAAVVYSSCFGLPAPPGDEVYREGTGFAMLNTTSVYSQVGRIRIEITGPDGKPASNCPFAASVFNYGALRTVARGTTGSDGTGVLSLGIGEFAITAGTNADRAFTVVKTEPGQVVTVPLQLRFGHSPNGFFWLHYPRYRE